MLRVGLTGGIGSGKSTVARVLGLLGCPVFVADTEARRLMEEDPALRQAIAERFGDRLYASGRLDRPMLAAQVFGDTQALAEINAMVHPAVRKAFSTWADRQVAPVVFMESAILVDTGGHRHLDRLVVVSAPEALRIQRVQRRDGATADEVRARMQYQASEAVRVAAAHHVIVNDDTQLVIPQVLAVYQALLNART